MMFNSALFVAAFMMLSSARAQDIVGLEDCARATATDKKIGCLQANVEFLHGLLKKSDAAAQAKLRENAAKLARANARLDELRGDLDRLKSAFEQLEKRVPKP